MLYDQLLNAYWNDCSLHWPGVLAGLAGFVGPGPAACCVCGRLPQPCADAPICTANCPSVLACFSATRISCGI